MFHLRLLQECLYVLRPTNLQEPGLRRKPLSDATRKRLSSSLGFQVGQRGEYDLHFAGALLHRIHGATLFVRLRRSGHDDLHADSGLPGHLRHTQQPLSSFLVETRAFRGKGQVLEPKSEFIGVFMASMARSSAKRAIYDLGRELYRLLRLYLGSRGVGLLCGDLPP